MEGPFLVPKTEAEESVPSSGSAPPSTALTAASLDKCVFCSSTLTPKEPSFILECLHVTCSLCSQHIDLESKVCPVCKVQTKSNMLLQNKLTMEFIGSVGEGTSSGEGDDKCFNHPEVVGNEWCENCGHLVCPECVTAHRTLKVTQHHVIIPKSDAERHKEVRVSSEEEFPCPNHPKETLHLYCESCSVMTCRDCQLSDHREHKYKFLKEIAEETRSEIRQLMVEIGCKSVFVNSAVKLFDQKRRKIEEKKSTLMNEINEMALLLTSTVKAASKKLIYSLNEMCNNKLMVSEERLNNLKVMATQMDYSQAFVDKFLQMTNDMSLVYTKNHVISHLQRIKQTKTHVPNPDCNISLQLVRGNIEKIVSEINSCAKIVEDPPVTMVNASPQGASNHGNLGVGPHYPQPGHPPALDHQPQRPPPTYQLQQQPQVQVYRRQVPPHPQHHAPTPQHLLHQLQQPAPRPPPSYHNTVHTLPVRSSNSQVSSSTHPHHIKGHNPDMVQLDAERNRMRKLLSQTQQQRAYQQMYQQQQQQQAPQQGMHEWYQSAAAQHQANQQQQMRWHPRAMTQPQINHHQQQQLLLQQKHQQMNKQIAMVGVHMQRQTQARTPPAAPSTSMISWHTPQTEGSSPGPSVQPQVFSTTTPGMYDDSFKIHLKPKTPPAAITPTSVSSSAPKTPSPLTLTKPDGTETLENMCQETLDEVLMTLKSLSNEKDGRKGSEEGGVHSSTEAPSSKTSMPPPPTTPAPESNQGEWQKEDPNEDWCAVCMDGGELVCCDNCPKVFHINCHIPRLSSVPEDPWQCLLCREVPVLPESSPLDTSLSPEERSVCERILLELYCQYDSSIHFRDPIPQDNTEYHRIIKKPMYFDLIRSRLGSATGESAYTNVQQFLQDLKLVFRNAKTFNPCDSQVHLDAGTLEDFLHLLLKKYLPQFSDTVDDEEITPVRKIRKLIHD